MTETTTGIDTNKVPAIFVRHVGTWQGEYIKTDIHGHFLRSFSGTFEVAIEGTRYRQVNHYVYPDGSRLELNFVGYFEDGILHLSSSSYSDFSAIAWDAGQETIGFRATKTQDGALITFMETMTLLAPDHRVRSTQAFKDGVFDGISFIEEVRVEGGVRG
ncbi:hypothetical protein K9N68_03550 [Kovacikia minuta CCNUW1]|uniref:DUF3598 family protein n=1 Tax=Kovacikia minuta TaxID=2931930 RepID=UPI001CCA4A2F|nr:DUF3598 family protein [Kovacikia minuta]UBF27060.1 hypothetical protein K9N68_03550 [Kovacikia minuta CCNUW1]